LGGPDTGGIEGQKRTQGEGFVLIKACSLVDLGGFGLGGEGGGRGWLFFQGPVGIGGRKETGTSAMKKKKSPGISKEASLNERRALGGGVWKSGRGALMDFGGYRGVGWSGGRRRGWEKKRKYS